MKPGNKNNGWIFERIYGNRENPKMIARRSRGGYPMNFGNKWTWLFDIAVIILIVILVIVL